MNEDVNNVTEMVERNINIDLGVVAFVAAIGFVIGNSFGKNRAMRNVGERNIFEHITYADGTTNVIERTITTTETILGKK